MNTASIISQFFDYKEILRVMPFGSGHINDTFRVDLLLSRQPASYLLQRVNRHVFPRPERVMENIVAVSNHLSGQTYPMRILTPVFTRDQLPYYIDRSGAFWRVFPFFEETTTFDEVHTEEQAYEAARAFGAFAKGLAGMDAGTLHITITGFHDGIRRMEQFRQVLKSAAAERLANARREIAFLLQHQRIFSEIAGLRLPLRVVHHDTKINNVLFDSSGSRAVCVIDLDTVMPGIVLSDFGDMMRTYTCPVNEEETDPSRVVFRWDFYQALRDGFVSEMGDHLTGEEVAHLASGGQWMTLMQVVRFLTDYLAGDIYYKTNYPDHNLQRAKNQLLLFQSMKKGSC